MHSTLELRWNFTPDTLFEEDFSSTYRGAEFHVAKGVVVVRIATDNGDTKPPIRAEVEQYVEGLLCGAQLVEHCTSSHTGPAVCVVGADGSRHFVLEAQPSVYRIRFGRADIRVTSSDGTVIDTKRERVDRKRSLALAAAELGIQDGTLARMFRSYRAAIEDAADELIHLFEVRESISSRFGSQTEALRSLRFPKARWSQLGLLCNELPLREGRHRGRFGSGFRSATEAELLEARSVAIELIQSYIVYLRSAA